MNSGWIKFIEVGRTLKWEVAHYSIYNHKHWLRWHTSLNHKEGGHSILFVSWLRYWRRFCLIFICSKVDRPANCSFESSPHREIPNRDTKSWLNRTRSCLSYTKELNEWRTIRFSIKIAQKDCNLLGCIIQNSCILIGHFRNLFLHSTLVSLVICLH